MAQITVDLEKCVHCGWCIQICPMGVIEEIHAQVTMEHPELCISCGHCALACNTSALSSNLEHACNPFTVSSVPEDIPQEQKVFHEKRSVRTFKPKIPEPDLLEDLVRYAEKAPSSHNIRKRKYVIITDPEKIAELERSVTRELMKLSFLGHPAVIFLVSLFSRQYAKELEEVRSIISSLSLARKKQKSPIFYNAPCIICIAAPSKGTQSKDDCIISQQYMMLYGHIRGVGSCIIGYAQYAHKTIEKILHVEEEYTIFAVSIFGYQKSPSHKEIQYSHKPSTRWFV